MIPAMPPDEPATPAPTFSPKAERAYTLCVAMLAKAPILGGLAQDIVFKMVEAVLRDVSRQLRRTEKTLAKAKDAFNVPQPAMPYLVLGALAVAVEGYPNEDERFQLYQAGREIGEYWTELVAAKIEKHLVAATTKGDPSS